ncbi:hypothetical protein ASD25_07510 [Brevundimonas sp. Root1423]|nr:hypothetical protein ASD25_07510 [Brevundimonas sp. Root1423]
MDEGDVWRLRGHENFGYSDGRASEIHLDKVFRSAKDLSSTSSELEDHIVDWASEYHLTRKRAQLLSGFKFDPEMTVLEVGCGCGSITRLLGERFGRVISVEGNIHRARLARLRTRDLDNVTVICAPFEEIVFAEKFDAIACIGVFEYSGSFVKAEDPYRTVLQYFSDMLLDDGVLILAIENQFGLKYFNAADEDHWGTPYVGIEGYHKRPNSVRTFGRSELGRLLSERFTETRYFYPYPDYKLPDVVIAEDFLRSGEAGEMVSQVRSRDYTGRRPGNFDEPAAVLELARNDLLAPLANSFLVIAGKDAVRGVSFDQEAVAYSSGRSEPFSTQTRIRRDAGNKLSVHKTLRNGSPVASNGLLELANCSSSWADGLSLQTLLISRSSSGSTEVAKLVEPARAWAAAMTAEAKDRDGRMMLSGEHIDSVWGNFYPEANPPAFIDREWVWKEDIPLNALAIRAVYNFLVRLEDASPGAGILKRASGQTLIREICSALGMEPEDRDIDDFVTLETRFQEMAYGLDPARYGKYLRWYLAHRPSLKAARGLKTLAHRVHASLTARFSLFRHASG